ncbi:hypothetical protein VTN77DRAFT_8841 [Rasamsonia byssochlamydoides]|uniref:uncharacterized protein n=1 Tax=Rasamsonia byssochlamydoides TaxID=89139 RepID=UPI0037446AE9
MKYFTSNTVLSVSSLLLWAGSVSADPHAAPAAAPTTLPLKAMTAEGCYSSAEGFKDLGSYTFQSSGYCQEQCVGQGYPVMALYNGGDCLCGNALPPVSAKAADSECNTPCNGWPEEPCGGSNAYNIFLTGTEKTVPTLSATSSSSTTAGGSPTVETTSVITEAGQTIIVTEAVQPGADAQSSSSGSASKTAGIAAGVVVGVIVLGAIAGGAFFFFRHKKRKEVEEEYRRNARINSFVNPNKPISTSSMTDSRWDGDYMAQRRQSNGSIADDEDFSRRILKVTNPDR